MQVQEPEVLLQARTSPARHRGRSIWSMRDGHVMERESGDRIRVWPRGWFRWLGGHPLRIAAFVFVIACMPVFWSGGPVLHTRGSDEVLVRWGGWAVGPLWLALNVWLGWGYTRDVEGKPWWPWARGSKRQT